MSSLGEMNCKVKYARVVKFFIIFGQTYSERNLVLQIFMLIDFKFACAGSITVKLLALRASSCTMKHSHLACFMASAFSDIALHQTEDN